MYSYSVADWIMIFFIYGFFGWIFESTYVSIRKREFVNRGFLKGPFLPIYAFGAIMMLFASIPFGDNPIAIYFAGMVAATLWEFIVGISMEGIFKVKYWDYSDQKFQFKGVICLSSSIAWGFLTLFLTEIIHKPVEKLVFLIPNVIEYGLVLVFAIIFVADAILSVRVALDLKQMLEKMTVMRKELEELREQLLEHASERKDMILKAASERRGKLEEILEEHWEELLENAPEKLVLYKKFKGKMQEYREYSKGYGLLKAQLLKAHPSASSAKYKEALKDVVEAIEEGIRIKKEKIKQKIEKKNED